MTRNAFSQHLVALLSLVGAAASVSALGAWIVSSLSIDPELLVALASVLISAVAGAYSWRIAEVARHLSRKPRVFLSYGSANRDLATDVAKALRAAGAEVWFDTEQVRLGEDWRTKIDRAMADSDTVVAVLGGETSPFVSHEIEMARKTGVRIIPVVVGETNIPEEIRSIRYLDLRRGDRQQALKRIVEAST